MLFPSVGTVQPARLVRALRRAALARGVRLFEGTRATRIADGLVETAGGRVRAPEIVVATNAWTTGWRPAGRRLTTFGSYVVLTEPAPDALAEIGWTGGEAIVDGRMFLHYFRTTEDGRVLMGSGSGPIGFGGRVDRRFTHDAPTVARAEAGLRELLPGLAGAKIERAWGGPIDVSSDHLPFFSTVPGKRIHYGAGYSGNGVGPSWLGGQILASLVLGADDEWSRLPLATRKRAVLPARAGASPRRRTRPLGDPRRRGGRGAGPPPAARRALRLDAPSAPRAPGRDALGRRPNTCSLRTCPSDCPMGQSLRRGCWGHGRCPGFPCSWGRSMDAGRGRRRRLGTRPCPTA